MRAIRDFALETLSQATHGIISVVSRLDQHISAVQNRLVIQAFFRALSLTVLIAATLILFGVGVDKLIGWLPPQPRWWVYGISAAAASAALVIALVRRPDPMSAAAAIEQKLGLQEKVSTALFARKQTDPFSIAAVQDAETTARSVVLNMGREFPLAFPKLAYAAAIVALATWLIAVYVAPMDLLGHQAANKKMIAAQQAQQSSKTQLENALAVVNSVPPALVNDEKIKLAKQNLTQQLAKGANDPAEANRSALKALQDVDAAIKEQVKNNVQFAQAKADEKMWKQIGEQPITDPGPVNDVRRELAQGKFSEAVNDLSNVVNKFDKMDKDQQQKAAQQMKQLAQQLQQQANPSPAQQQQQQQQLQQMGMNQQQAQQAQQLMQQAANGNKQAQQQLQQMAKQAMAQMNNGQGPTAQQQQQMQQMMQQMQAGANNQAQAQQMAQAAQQMAQAMQQQSSQQGQQGQQSQGQQAGGQKSGQQGGQQQAMSGAMQQMQQQLQQMQAVSGDAQQIAAAQQAAQNGLDGNGGGAGGQQPGQWPGNNNPQQGPQGGGKGQGQGNGGGKGFGSKG
ncbi:MAG: hypothetical protein JO353_09750, partial [Phycisphaerae bacterium]|nr:hypothetical protein [Phycisphaerae bacterium]